MTGRVLISGYYGFGNLGDEALLEVIVGRLRRDFPAASIEVLSATPQRTAADYRVDATPRWDWRAVRAAIGRADVVLSGGGGLLQNGTSLRSLLYYAAILREAIRTGRKAMIFAQSIGPLDFWGRWVVQRLLQGARSRDRARRAVATAARRAFAQVPVERTADPVFLYDRPAARADLAADGLGPESGAYAVISVRKVASFRDGIPVLARAIDRLAERHNVRAAFLPLGGAADAAAVDRRHSRLLVGPRPPAGMHARKGGRDFPGRSGCDRHASARAGPGRAIRRPVSCRAVRSKGDRALRGSRLSAAAAVDSGQTALRAATQSTSSSTASSPSVTGSRRNCRNASRSSKRLRSETSRSSASF